jgi:hypothetical protein
MLGLLGLLISAALGGCDSDVPTGARVEAGCYLTGCGNRLCSDLPDVASTCIGYATDVCYRDATCARQPNGACGWTPTPELNACLATHSLHPDSQP